MDLYINDNILVYGPMDRMYREIIGVDDISDVDNGAEWSDDDDDVEE